VIPDTAFRPLPLAMVLVIAWMRATRPLVLHDFPAGSTARRFTLNATTMCALTWSKWKMSVLFREGHNLPWASLFHLRILSWANYADPAAELHTLVDKLLLKILYFETQVLVRLCFSIPLAHQCWLVSDPWKQPLCVFFQLPLWWSEWLRWRDRRAGFCL